MVKVTKACQGNLKIKDQCFHFVSMSRDVWIQNDGTSRLRVATNRSDDNRVKDDKYVG